MRYFILFSLLWFLQFALSQPSNVNPATPAVITAAMSFASKYQYSIVPPTVLGSGPSAIFWWTPDVANNQIHFGVMGGEDAFVGLGFNNQTTYPMMVPGFAVVGTPDNVTLHALLDRDQSQVPVLMDQSNIQNSKVVIQDGYIFMEFTWVMKPPVFFPVDKPVNLIWATRQGSQPYFQFHDNQDTLTSFTFTAPQNFSGYQPAQVVRDCGYGSTNGFYSFIGACICPPGFTAESNCTESSHQHKHIFMDTFMNQEILTMYWTLNDTNLDIVIQSYYDPKGSTDQWAGIAFCGPEGYMGPADAVIAPNLMPAGVPISVYISIPGTDGITTDTSLTLQNTVFSHLSGYNYFSFRRILSDGKLSITDVTSVPIIAARAPTSWSSLIKHTLYSRTADLINLQSGGIKPPQFFWTNQVTHGFLMWFSWALLIPCGFIWARFIKGYPNDKSALWFEGHRTLMSIGFIIVVISGAYIIALTSTHLDGYHKILGVTVLIGALYQVMSAVMRPHADPTNPSPQRLVFEYTHHFVGRATIIIAWVAIGYGLSLVPGISMSVVWGHVALSAIWLIFYFILEVRKQIIMRRNRDYESLNRR